jgi:hypothetical protein
MARTTTSHCSEVSRPPLASCRSLWPTAIALLLVILVRSLRHQGWRDLGQLDRGALLHGGGLVRLIANGAGPISKRSPRSLCYKRFPQVRRRSFERRELAFLFLTLSDHFYAPSIAYDRTFPTLGGVASTMKGRHRRLDMQPPPSLGQLQSGANHSSSRSPMALKFLIALCEAPRTAFVKQHVSVYTA